MSRYFIETGYKGTFYSGFQTQKNANTIQAEIEKAIQTLYRHQIQLTGSSRTDAGVHAWQNFLHFDIEADIHPQFIYKMNALLPKDIVIHNIYLMGELAHSRFDAIYRSYQYRIHSFKNPFIEDYSYYYPYKLNKDLMHEAALLIKNQTNFYSFCKVKSQVKTYQCIIEESNLVFNENECKYDITANRFLRGMVRMIVGSLLKIGRGQLGIMEFAEMIKNGVKMGNIVPSNGLILKRVQYPKNYFIKTGESFTGN